MQELQSTTSIEPTMLIEQWAQNAKISAKIGDDSLTVYNKVGLASIEQNPLTGGKAILWVPRDPEPCDLGGSALQGELLHATVHPGKKEGFDRIYLVASRDLWVGASIDQMFCINGIRAHRI